MQIDLPPGYVEFDQGRIRVVATRLNLDSMVALLTGPERDAPLDAAAAGKPGRDRCADASRSGKADRDARAEAARAREPDRDAGANATAAGGRGGARHLVLPGGRSVWLRHYLRGGFMRYLVRDLYLLRPPRPLRELVATEAARAAGCRVPTVHAVCVQEAGPFYRGWIVTSAIEKARPLIECYLAAPSDERQALLARVGAAVAYLHRSGVYHVDLTGHNLLVDAEGAVHTIDFDKAIVAAPADEALVESGLRRLMRSLIKLCAEAGQNMEPAARSWVDRGYRR